MQPSLSSGKHEQVEATLQSLSEQLMALSIQHKDAMHCHNCGKQLLGTVESDVHQSLPAGKWPRDHLDSARGNVPRDHLNSARGNVPRDYLDSARGNAPRRK